MSAYTYNSTSKTQRETIV